MLDHVSIRVVDYDRSKKFYQDALAPLGYTLAMETPSGAGFRRGHIPNFWIKQGRPMSVAGPMEPHELAGCGGAAVHIAFAGEDREAVDAFYHAALAAGGQDNGAPSLRPEYHSNYYGAFILDPDGYNVEAVCHNPELRVSVATTVANQSRSRPSSIDAAAGVMRRPGSHGRPRNRLRGERIGLGVPPPGGRKPKLFRQPGGS